LNADRAPQLKAIVRRYLIMEENIWNPIKKSMV
jgi:hypothetical protein